MECTVTEIKDLIMVWLSVLISFFLVCDACWEFSRGLGEVGDGCGGSFSSLLRLYFLSTFFFGWRLTCLLLMLLSSRVLGSVEEVAVVPEEYYLGGERRFQ